MKAIFGACALGWLVACGVAGTHGQVAVYHQVTYADGRVEDLAAPPAGNEGILRVLRITRPVEAARGSVVLSTGPEPVRTTSPGVSRVELTWDGRAWIAPAPPLPIRRAPAPVAWEELAAQLDALYRLEEQLSERLARMDGEQPTTQSTGGDPASDPAAGTRRLLERVRELIADGEQRLTERLGGAGAGAAPSGEVERLNETEGPDAATRPAAGELPAAEHKVQVWPIPEQTGTRTYHVSLPHAEAGATGAFCYVAYADTDGDGTPDQLIARSPLVSAERPGQRTGWSFRTGETRVFVGNAWLRDDAVRWADPLCEPGPDEEWILSDEVYVSGYFGQVPRNRRAFLPYIHGLRVRLRQPERHDTDGSEIIRRRRGRGTKR